MPVLTEREAKIVNQAERWRMALRRVAIRHARTTEYKRFLTPDIEANFATVWEEAVTADPICFEPVDELFHEFLREHITCEYCESPFAETWGDVSPCGGAVAHQIKCHTCGKHEAWL